MQRAFTLWLGHPWLCIVGPGATHWSELQLLCYNLESVTWRGDELVSGTGQALGNTARRPRSVRSTRPLSFFAEPGKGYAVLPAFCRERKEAQRG